LTQLTRDADAEVRTEAFRALRGRAGEGLAETFAEGAQDPDYEVATIALAALAQTGDRSQSAALAALLESENPYLAISAAHTILTLAGSPR
jgi:HEAT repeat protein